MKKVFNICSHLFIPAFLLLVNLPLFAQKNVTAVSQTNSLNLQLPLNSKQDKRFLSISAAKVLLEMESKKEGTGISSVEVYMLPPVTGSGYNSDSLVLALSTTGYEIAGVEADDKFAWVHKNNRTYLLYFSMDKNETNLYIGTCAVVPGIFQQTTQSTNTVVIHQQEQSTTQHTSSTQTQAQQNHTEQTTATSGYQFSTSSFDDGWNSTIQNNWVAVEKNKAFVYLYYAVNYNSDHFTGTGVMDRDYYWDNYVAKQFNISSKQYKDDGEFVSSLKPKYVEGWGTDLQTGAKRFIAMILSVAPNAAQLTVASFPDEQAFRQQFPRANDKYNSDLMNMNRYNKFAVSSGDLTGTWQSGGNQMTQWYNAVTGAYSGATFASSSATFIFQQGGKYSSIHNGATGAVGTMSSFQQEYKGAYTVQNWQVTATNRYQGKTEQFDAHFQAVKGGRLLYLNDNKGGNYLLVKIK